MSAWDWMVIIGVLAILGAVGRAALVYGPQDDPFSAPVDERGYFF